MIDERALRGDAVGQRTGCGTQRVQAGVELGKRAGNQCTACGVGGIQCGLGSGVEAAGQACGIGVGVTDGGVETAEIIQGFGEVAIAVVQLADGGFERFLIGVRQFLELGDDIGVGLIDVCGGIDHAAYLLVGGVQHAGYCADALIGSRGSLAQQA